ncbi:OsmC family protein [Pseudomonas sp. CrR25]|nr:OsmC family protein [Pseudomonas sp. CrR25]
MAEYSAEVFWQRGEQNFLDNRYSRGHCWRFDGGLEVPASSSPHVVPLPWSDPTSIDPEEAFVASLSSCHMLWFLSLAAKQGFQVDRYRDQARGVMARNAEGRLAMTEVLLRPCVTFARETQPSTEQLHILHHQAHEACFIANSVKTEVRCEPQPM